LYYCGNFADAVSGISQLPQEKGKGRGVMARYL